MRCKGTIWTAGFPLSNIQVKVRNTLDFIGPSIDIGFRIAKYSSKRKLCLSIETIYMFCEAVRDIRKSSGSDKSIDFGKIKFEGQEELKGVFNNAPYPLFWLDMSDKESDNYEDEWLGRGKNCIEKDVIDYCVEYIEKSKYIFKPFIYNGKGKFNKITDEIKARCRDAIIARNDPKENELVLENETEINSSDKKKLKINFKDLINK